MSATETVADYCHDYGNFVICGTDMEEVKRESEGKRWCFHCRKRHEFWWVVMAPVGLSYYGPSAHMEGVRDGCTDLFPGWFRASSED